MLNSEKETLENKIKKFCLAELETAKIKNHYALGCRNQAFGVIFFACNELFDTYNSALADWWDREILPQFNNITMGVSE